MDIQRLQEKIEQKEARLAVIGLGYVGLPVAAMFADVGFDVLGVEIKLERAQLINNGHSPIDENEPGLAHLLKKVVKAGNLHVTGSYEALRDRDVILIDVETPVDDRHIPRYEALRKAVSDLACVLKDGALVIVEATIAPGTMEKTVLPLLESTEKKLGKDFFLGNCPERVMPGKLLSNLSELSRVVGGDSPETARAMASLYRFIVKADLDIADWVTAELVKTVENTYRDVQIAFANEVALICEALGGDVWKVRELVNKSPFRQMHLPGAGVGGHCIPKDPWLLAYGVEDQGVSLHIIPAARRVNNSMPLHIAEMLERGLSRMKRSLNGARILIMGYAYLEDSDDSRNSPSEALFRYLTSQGSEVVVHDPYVPEYQGNLFEKAQGCDAAVLMVAHRQYRQLDTELLKKRLNFPLLVDGRNIFHSEEMDRNGWDYSTVGKATPPTR